MKKLFVIFLCLFIYNITFTSQTQKPKVPVKKNKIATYEINKNDLMREIHLVNCVVFNNKDIDKWDMLMVGTISAETNFGQYKGKSKAGITQITRIGLGYINSRLDEDDKMIIKLFGYDHTKIKFEDMEKDNRLSIIMGAIYMKHKTNGNPPTTLLAAAKVWKKHYNTSAGKGTIEGFVKKHNYHGNKTMMAFYNTVNQPDTYYALN